jgi:hypothetical protein
MPQRLFPAMETFGLDDLWFMDGFNVSVRSLQLESGKKHISNAHPSYKFES